MRWRPACRAFLVPGAPSWWMFPRVLLVGTLLSWVVPMPWYRAEPELPHELVGTEGMAQLGPAAVAWVASKEGR